MVSDQSNNLSNANIRKQVMRAPSPELLTNEGLAYVTEHTLETILSQSIVEGSANDSNASYESIVVFNEDESENLGPTDQSIRGSAASTNGNNTNKALPHAASKSTSAVESDGEDAASIVSGLDDDEGEDISTHWFKDTIAMYEGNKWYQRPTVHMLLFVVAIKVLSFTVTITPSVELLMEKICTSLQDEQGQCNMSLVQKEQSKVQSIITFFAAGLGFITAGKYGEISDRFGRVFVLQVNGVITLIHVVFALYVYAPQTRYSRTMIIICQSIEALGGGLLTLIATGNSYVSDIVPPSERLVSISVLMSIIYGTLGLGPLIGSFIIKLFDGNNFAPFYFSVLFSVVFLVMVYFFIIESRHHDARRYSQTEREQYDEVHGLSLTRSVIGVFEPLKHLWMPRTYSGSLVPRINIIILLTMDTLFVASSTGCIPALFLYSMLKYKWGSVELGYYVSITGLGRAFVLLVLIPQIILYMKKTNSKYFKALDRSLDRIDLTVLKVSIFFMFWSIAVVLLVQSNSSGLYIGAALQTLSAVISPTIQSVVVKYASKKITGQVFGGMSLLRNFVMLICPVLFLQIYSHTVDKNPSLFLYIPLMSSILCFVLSFFLKIVEDPEMLRRPSEVALLDEETERRMFEEQEFAQRRSSSSESGSPALKINRKSSLSSLNSGKGFVTGSPKSISSNKQSYRSIMERRPSVLDK